MLRSSNPVLSRSDAFTPGARAGYDQYPQYPGQQGFGPQDPQRGGHPQDPQRGGGQGLMTFDDVVTKTAVMLGIVVIVAAAAFFFMPMNLLMPATIVAALSTVVLTLVVAFRRKISPGLVFLFAVVEGVFVGGMSKVFENAYDGIVFQAVFATMVAAGLTLAAYKFFNIRVTPKFQKVVVIATIAFAAVALLNFGLSLAGISTGFRAGVDGPVSLLAIAVSAIAVVLAVLNLVLDFDYIERGIEMGAPASESWKAAFGLTVTLVWLYIEMLRIISYFRR